jgi:hypothetical protein
MEPPINPPDTTDEDALSDRIAEICRELWSDCAITITWRRDGHWIWRLAIDGDPDESGCQADVAEAAKEAERFLAEEIERRAIERAKSESEDV